MPESQRAYAAALVAILAAAAGVLVLRDLRAGTMFLLFAVPVVMAAWLWKTRRESDRYAAQLEEQAMEHELQTTELEQQMQEAQSLREALEDAHEALKHTASVQLAEAQALARLGSWEWDVEANRVTWSDEMYRLYGLEPGSVDVDYERYQSLLHPDDRELAHDVVSHSLQAGVPFSYDHRVKRADGEVRIFHARGRVVSDSSGKPVRMYGTGQDVTEARRADAALREAAEYAARQNTAEEAARHLNRVFAQAPVLIAVLRGPQHTFELVNATGIEMLGVDDVLGRKVREALPDVAAQGFGDLLDTVFTTGEPFVGREMPAQLGPANQSRQAFYNFVFQPLSEEGAVYGVLVVATEVTDLVRSRISAEESQRQAVAASRAKSEFLARMSHELRTPLAAIIGYGELLADGITGPVNDEQKRQLKRIRSSANHLLSIIDEILTLARMDAGKENVDLRDVNVVELLESVATMAEPLVAAKGLRFDVVLPPVDAAVRTDAVKLRQVLLNLISNAVKYTDSGRVTVGIEVADGVIQFMVSDTGVGLAEEHLEKIFEPFWQVEQTTTRRSGGTGLGLAVTRQFVDLLGGSMRVSSRVGEGSTFSVVLPAGGAPTSPESART